MMNAAVEFVVHPRGGHVVEQVERLVDQVFVIEQTATILLGAEARYHSISNGEQRGAAVTRLERTPAPHQHPDAVPLLKQPLAQLGMVLLNCRGDNPVFCLLAFAGAENVEIGVEQIGAGQRGERMKSRALEREDRLLLVADREAVHSELAIWLSRNMASSTCCTVSST